MAGFKNPSLCLLVKQNYYEDIIEILKRCSSIMISKDIKIQNHEEKITAHIAEKYLKNNCVVDSSFPFAFETECKENFNPNTNTYLGRADIRVSSSNCLFRKNPKDYYTIECKRIDGKANLNQNYVKEGVARFIIPPVKYESYHNKNIMFAYVVETINISQNTDKINDIQLYELGTYITKNLACITNKSTSNCYVYESEYNTQSTDILLTHIFSDFSNIIIKN